MSWWSTIVSMELTLLNGFKVVGWRVLAKTFDLLLLQNCSCFLILLNILFGRILG